MTSAHGDTYRIKTRNMIHYNIVEWEAKLADTMKRKNRIRVILITAAAIIALFVIAGLFVVPKAKKRYLGKRAEEIVAQMSVDEKIGQVFRRVRMCYSCRF